MVLIFAVVVFHSLRQQVKQSLHPESGHCSLTRFCLIAKKLPAMQSKLFHGHVLRLNKRLWKSPRDEGGYVTCDIQGEEREARKKEEGGHQSIK